MDKQKILDFKPGDPEFIEAVAVEVMNYRPRNVANVDGLWVWVDRNSLVIPGDYDPTTNIEQAWEVVEKMREDGFTYSLRSKGDMDDCTFLRTLGEDPLQVNYGRATGKTPDAICRAALQAVAERG